MQLFFPGALGAMLALLCSDSRLRRRPALGPAALAPAPALTPAPAPAPVPAYRAALHSLVEGITLSGQNLCIVKYRDAVSVFRGIRDSVVKACIQDNSTVLSAHLLIVTFNVCSEIVLPKLVFDIFWERKRFI